MRRRADEEIAKRESEFKEMLEQMERDHSQKEQVGHCSGIHICLTRDIGDAQTLTHLNIMHVLYPIGPLFTSGHLDLR